MTYGEVLKLPLRTFWSFNRQIDRLRAERDQRALRISLAAQEPKAATQLIEALRIELDSPVVFEKRFDSSKFEELSKRFAKGGASVTKHTQKD